MMDIRVRITCDGWTCRQKNGNLSVFEGWVRIELLGSDRIMTLRGPLPDDWVTRYHPDSNQPDIHCPTCAEGSHG